MTGGGGDVNGDRIRVGVIGVGWGSIVLVPAFRAVPEYDVVALCSRNADRVNEAGQRLGIGDTSTDWESFVERDDLDVVAICTPTDLHHAQTIAALRAGRHVLCEKPVALDAEQAREMLTVAEDAGRLHAVNFEGRWLSDRLAVWERVREGFVGSPLFARVSTVGGLWHPTRPLQSEWMYRQDAGGGYLMGLSSHDIDYLCGLFGEPEAVCADVRATVPVRQRADGSRLDVTADDTSTVLIRMRSGLVVTVATTMTALGVDSRVLEIYGTEGSLEVDSVLLGSAEQTRLRGCRSDDPVLHDLPTSDRQPRSGAEIPSRRAGPAIRALALMLEDWLPAFDGAPTPRVPSLRDGWVTQSVVDAARRSSDGAGWVPLVLQ